MRFSLNHICMFLIKIKLPFWLSEPLLKLIDLTTTLCRSCEGLVSICVHQKQKEMQGYSGI